MSWDYHVSGAERFSAFIAALAAAGINYQVEPTGGTYERDQYTGESEPLRLARFQTTTGQARVVEEYIASTTHYDDGLSVCIDVSVYDDGQCPSLVTKRFSDYEAFEAE